jgi:ribosomal protein S27AE
MTINLKTLKCGECGSGDLRRQAQDEYVCGHCGSVSLVEHSVSRRLERMLAQVTVEAGPRLSDEESARRRRLVSHALAWGVGLGLAVAVATIAVTRLADRPRSPAPGAATVPMRPALPRGVPPDALKLDEPRQVLVRRGSSSSGKLLVMARNTHDAPLQRASIEAAFFDETQSLGKRSQSLPLETIAPGEALPVLIDLPSQGTVTRQDLQVRPLSTPHRSVAAPALKFTRARLVQAGDDEPRFVGRIVNDREGTIAGVEALVTLLDDSGAVIGVGHGYGGSGELKPGQRTALDFGVQRFGRGEVAAWEVRVGYSLLQSDGARAVASSPDRAQRTTGGPERIAPLPTSGEDLLATEAERFDVRQLEMLPVTALRDNTQRPIHVTELVNRSSDAIVLSPALLLTPLDGARAGRPIVVAEAGMLYPGERLPILLQPYGVERVTGWRTEWKPMRKAALPGSRPALEVAITGTQALEGSALVNFTHRYRTRYVEVTGTVHNPGPGIVRKLGLWVMLRDAQGRLAGFQRVGQLPAASAGDSVPFSARIDLWGRDFAKVTTLLQAE